MCGNALARSINMNDSFLLVVIAFGLVILIATRKRISSVDVVEYLGGLAWVDDQTIEGTVYRESMKEEEGPNKH